MLYNDYNEGLKIIEELNEYIELENDGFSEAVIAVDKLIYLVDSFPMYNDEFCAAVIAEMKSKLEFYKTEYVIEEEEVEIKTIKRIKVLKRSSK